MNIRIQSRGSRRVNNRSGLSVLDQCYSLPRPLDCWEEWQRAIHADLPLFTVPELMVERDRVNLRLLLDRASSQWLQHRLKAIETEIAGRQSSEHAARLRGDA